MGKRQFSSLTAGFTTKAPAEVTSWRLEKFILEKRWGDDLSVEPYEVIEGGGNMLTYGGAAAMWQLFMGEVFDPFDSGSFLGVGDDDTAADRTQTDLIAASNKYYIPMDATYPLHTDGTGSGNAVITYKGTAGTSNANFDWNEWGLFNASTGGRMANRKVEFLGTKTGAASWTLTIVISLS